MLTPYLKIAPSNRDATTTTTTNNTSTTHIFDNFQFEASTATNVSAIPINETTASVQPKILKISTIPTDYADTYSRHTVGNVQADQLHRTVSERRKVTKMRSALDQATKHGLQEMMEMYGIKEPELLRKGKWYCCFFLILSIAEL